MTIVDCRLYVSACVNLDMCSPLTIEKTNMFSEMYSNTENERTGGGTFLTIKCCKAVRVAPMIKSAQSTSKLLATRDIF